MAVRSKYQPFSFQERITPLLMLKEEHDKISEGLANLSETASQYYQFLDPETRKQIDAYNATLDSVAGSLSSEGMKAVNRNTLNNLRRQYSSQIKPIQEAAQTAATMYAQVREMQLKDPTLIVQSMPTVKQLMEDPAARPSAVSGSKLMEEGANAALMLPGVTYDQLSRYLNGDTNAIPDIDSIVQSISNNYGVSTAEALAYIQRGITTGLGKRATTWEMTKQEADYKFSQDMAKLRYQAGVQASARAASANSAHERLVAQMLLQGFVPDNTAPGGFRRDPELARQIQSTRGTLKSGSGAGGRGTTQYMNRTKGTVGYNPDGTYAKSQDIPKDAQQINDITKASTEEKVLALKHAGIPIEDYKLVGKDGYSPEDIDRIVEENIDVLGAYRFWTTTKGRRDKRRVTGFWGTDTSVTREVDAPFGGFEGYSNPYSSSYYDYSDSFNELPEEY